MPAIPFTKIKKRHDHRIALRKYSRRVWVWAELSCIFCINVSMGYIVCMLGSSGLDIYLDMYREL